VPTNRRVFYEQGRQDETEFDAKVLWVGQGQDETLVVLDQTCFFHETGGQPGDQGTLTVGGAGGAALQVRNATKDGDQVVHHVETNGALQVGATVHGTIDWGLRQDHMRSHTATHIVNQSVRRILGPHSWQAGTQKYRDCARVDMTHYRRPTREEIDAIEALANRIVMQSRPVTATWLTRDQAEARWGMQLLQGGIPKGRDVRVVRIGPTASGADLEGPHGTIRADEDYDVEYCGGTHCQATHEVGPVKIWRTERVQDGVERFEYSAGLHAVKRWQEPEALLRTAAEAMEVAPADVPNASRRFFEEWKERGKMLEAVQKQLAELAANAPADGEEVAGVTVHLRQDLPAGAMQMTAEKLLAGGKSVVLFGAADNGKVRLLFARSADVELHMGQVLAEAAPLVEGRGGGKPEFAQGGGTKVEGLAAALAKARDVVAERLRPTG
jgi:alanyl-tRNA synthetase